MICSSCWRSFLSQGFLQTNARGSGRSLANTLRQSPRRRQITCSKSRELNTTAASRAEADKPGADTDTSAANVGTGKRPEPKGKKRDAKQSAKPKSLPNATAKLLPSEAAETKRKSETWRKQKRGLESKFPEGYSPRKRLSPDTLPGIRMLHASDPQTFSTPVLAEHFKVSPEAIRRILKSKWRPNDEQEEDRRLRWDRRGERIWTQLAELGTRPPKKWRAMGVGRVDGSAGEVPAWKRKRHAEEDEYVPFVDDEVVDEPALPERPRFAGRLL